MAKLSILDPRASLRVEDRPPVAGLDSLEGRVIGILDNGQVNSTPVFRQLADLLRERHHVADILLRTKPTYMQGAPEALRDEMVRRCAAVITGLGA